MIFFFSFYPGTGVAVGRAAEPTVSGQSSSEVQLITPELHHTATGKESRENSPPPKVRCPCGVHEVKFIIQCSSQAKFKA